MISQTDRDPSLSAAPSSSQLSHAYGSVFELSQGSLLSQSSQRSATSGSIFRRGNATTKRRRQDSNCSSNSNSNNNDAGDAASNADELGADRSSSFSCSIAVPAFKSARSLASKQQAAMTMDVGQPALQVDSASAQASVIAPAPSTRDPEVCAAAAAAPASAAKPFQARMHHRQRLARTAPIDVTPPQPSSFIAITRAIASAEDLEAAELLSAVPLCVNWQPTVKGKRRMRRDQQRVTVSSGFGRKRVSFSSAVEPGRTVMRVTEVLDDDISMLEVEHTKQQQQEAIIDLTEADADAAGPAEYAPAIESASSAPLSQPMASDEVYWPQVDLRLAVPGVLKKRNLVPAKTFPGRRLSRPRNPSPQPQQQRARKRKAKAQSIRRAIERDSDDDDWIVDDAAVEAEEAALEAQGFDESEEIESADADPRALIKQEFVTSITERAPPAVPIEATVEEELKQPEGSTIVVESTAPMLSQPPPKLKRLLRLSECIPTLPPMPAVLPVAPKPLAAQVAANDHGDIAEDDDEENKAAVESPAPAAAAAAAAPSVRKGSDVMHDDDGYPLPWINLYTDSPPPNYKHLTGANTATDDVDKLESVHRLFKGCSCKGKCWATSCECRVRGSAGYTAPDVVRAQTVEGLTLWECNSSCPCNASCLNRVSQRLGTSNDSLGFYLFRHAEEGLGWGVKCKSHIERGQYIGEYMGVLKGEDECCQEHINDEYMFTIFPNLLHGEDVAELEQLLEARGCASMDEMLANWPRVTVDACDAGNVTRFINHSCDPNVVSIQVYSEDRSPHRAKILLFARVPIPAHKELSIDYHYERNPRTGGEWPFVCNCGSVKCQHPTARVRNQLEKQRLDELLEAHTDVDEE